MKKLINLLSLLVIFFASSLTAQVLPPNVQDSLKRYEFCGATAEYARGMNDMRVRLMNGQNPGQTSPYRYVVQDSFPSNLIVRCGRFRIYYEDFLRTPARGFADAAVGAARRSTLCGVLNHVDSIINITDTLDIFVNQSFSDTNHYTGTGGVLAFAGSEFPSNFTTISGIHNGYCYDHITTGVDPNTHSYDMDITVNFDRYWDATTSTYIGIYYFDNYLSLPAGNCKFDLFSVLLHEVTHGMGWTSFIAEDPAFRAYNGNFGTVYSNSFSRYDNLFLYKGDILTGTFTKLINTTPQIDPSITGVTNALRVNDIWLYNNGAPLNQPIYSGDWIGNPVSVGSLISHLNFNMFSLPGMSQFSPGYQCKYVMGPFFERNEIRRKWTIPEIRALLALGYTLRTSYSTSTSLNGTDQNGTLLTTNEPPYRTDPATHVTETSGNPNFPEAPLFDTVMVNNNTPTSLTASQLTINLSSLNIADNDGDLISIMPNSLFALRGCSMGSNDHNRLNVNTAGTSIVYTPAPGYNGIAQFGFYLWDGHERGAFKTYTINVQRGSYSPSVGTTLAVNGSFEDGTEVRDKLNLSKPYTGLSANQEGEYWGGTHFSGGHPFSFFPNGWGPYGAGTVIRNAGTFCGDVITTSCFPTFGSWTSSSNVLHTTDINPLPTTTPGITNDRYIRFNYGAGGTYDLYINLVDTLTRYKYYAISYDMAFAADGGANHVGDNVTWSFKFVGDPIPNYMTTPIYQSYNLNCVIAGINNAYTDTLWQHLTDTVQYCSANPCFTIAFKPSRGKSFIDNFSIVEIANPPLLTSVTASLLNTAAVCAGDSIHLHAEPNIHSCNIQYVWQPGNIVGQDIVIANPLANTSYIVTATDPIDTTHHVYDTINVFSPANTTIAASSIFICAGSSTTLTASGATTYVWSPGGSTSNPITVSPAVNTDYIVTGTNGSCVSTDTISIKVQPASVATFSYTGSPYCKNASNPFPTFSGGGTAGVFSASPSGLVFVSTATGQVDLSASTAGTYTVTNTIAATGVCPGVSATATITITPLPVATFSYTGTPYCKTGTNPSPTYSGGGVAGTFTASPSGLSINSSTGTITLSSSTAGTYTVTNTIAAAGGCPAVIATATITITAPSVATFSYTGTPYCKTFGSASPTFSGGGVAGTFTASPAGLTINSSTGTVTTSTSTAGTYTVTNTIAASGGCPSVASTATITITAPPIATFSYTGTPYCKTFGSASPTYSGGGVAGTFTASPAGLTINSSTGTVTTSSSTAGTYTVTNTIAAAGGCPVVTATATITITAPPVATFSYTGTPYCKTFGSASPTFSGGGVAGTFTSSPAGLTINASSGAVTTSSSTAGTYTVTNTIAAAGGCAAVAATATITITAPPVATFSYPGTPYCKTFGSASPTFSGGGAAGTFTASPAGLTINASTGTVTTSTSTAGTYTVTNTRAAAGGCPAVTATATITITTPPVATFSYTGSPYCSTASNPSPTFSGGGVAGTFSSTAGLVFVNTATGQVNISSSTAGTYTVTNTIAASGGCAAVTATSTITLDPVCKGTTVISTAAGNNTFSTSTTLGTGGITYSVVDDITVTAGTLTIKSPDMRFYPGKKIILSGTATLVVDSAWLHACGPCASMWGGIQMDRTNTVQVIDGSVIEDATVALATTTTGTGAPNFTINKAIFNKNGIAIKLGSYTTNTTNVIKNTIITCRTLPAPVAGGFASYYTTLKGAMMANSLASYPKTTTLAGSRSQKGIEFTDVFHNGSTLAAVGSSTFVSGNANLNVFDNLDYGVYLTNSAVKMVNTTCQNMLGVQPFCIGCANDPTGVGVYAPTQTITNNAGQLLIGTTAGGLNACTFRECFRGVEVNNYLKVEIYYSSFTCSLTPTTISSTVPSMGSNGVFLKNIVEKALVNYNATTNIITAMQLSRNTASTSNIPEIDFNGNFFSANSNGYCTQALLITDVSTNTIATAEQIYVRNNTSSDINNGVKALNIKNNLVIYDNDSLKLRYNPSGTYGGIWLEGCDKTEIKNNAVVTSRGTYGSADNWDERGIYIKSSTGNKIFCNELSSLGECIVVEGPCSSTTAGGTGYGILGNNMKNCRTGFMLKNSGAVGDQGDATTIASGNHWINSGLNFPDGHTYVSSSAPASSKLYVITSGTSNPTINSGTPAYAAPGTIGTSSGSEISCPTTDIPAGLAVSSGTSFGREMRAPILGYSDELKEMLINSTTSGGIFIPSNWMTQDYIFNEVKNNSDLQTDSLLFDFYTSNENTGHGIISSINVETENHNYSQAILLNNSLVPTNVIEQNHKTFNSVYLDHTDSIRSYTAAEYNDLNTIAHQCAILGGNAVYQSRNLLMAIENRVIDFGDSCDLISNTSYVRSADPKFNTALMKVYPNPSTGKITLECNLETNQSGLLQIYDLTGNIVGSYTLASGTKILTINAEGLQGGMYQYNIVIDGKSSQKGKLVIIK